MPAPPKPWEMTLEEYLGRALITDDDVLSPEYLERARAEVARYAETLVEKRRRRRRHPARKDLVYRLDGRRIFLYDAATDACVAGDHLSFPVVMEEAVGRGYGAEIAWLRDHLGKHRMISAFSPSGFRARRSAHRLHVERALKRGDAVPDEVMVSYEAQGGRLRLRQPYEPADHAARNRAIELAQARDALERISEGYAERFLSPEEFLETGGNDHGCLPEAFAAALAEDTGAPLALVVRGTPDDISSGNGTAAWLYVDAGEFLVNAFGACRPADLVRHPDEILDRGAKSSITRIESFPDPGRLVEALESDERCGLDGYCAMKLEVFATSDFHKDAARGLPAFALAREAIEARLEAEAEAPAP